MRSLVLLVATLAVVTADHIHVNVSDIGWSVQFQGHTYNGRKDSTSFFYEVSCSGSCQDLIYFVIGGSGSCSSKDPKPMSQWNSAATHHEVTGYRWNGAQDKSATHIYELSFAGAVAPTATEYLVAAGTERANAATTGPDCNSSPSYSVPNVPADSNITCQNQAAIDTAKQNASGVHAYTIPGRCPAHFTIKRLHFATTGTTTLQNYQLVVVDDTTPPSFGSGTPTSITLDCNDTAVSTAGADTLPANAVIDNCDDNPHVAFCTEELESKCHNKYIVNTWTATDECGNSECHTQTIAVVDTTPPDFDVPQDRTEECHLYTDPGTTLDISPTDDCDPGQLNKKCTREKIAGSCSKTYTIKNKCSAWDDCNNTRHKMQKIHVVDTTPPEFTPSSLDMLTKDVQSVTPPFCFPDPPVTVTASDLCDPNEVIHVTVNETRTNGTCPHKFTVLRTWSAADSCGNPQSISRVVSVQDNTDPTSNVDTTTLTMVECGTVPPIQTPNVDDNCDPNPTYTSEEKNITTACEFVYAINRSWVVTDACGNSNYYERRIEVVDTTPPVLGSPTHPNGTEFHCNGTIPSCEDMKPTATDTCAGVTKSASVTAQMTNYSQCSGAWTFTCTYTAHDCIQNTATEVYEYKVIDPEDPVMTPIVTPAVTDECYDRAPPGVTATDSCSDATVVRTSSNSTGACASNYTVQWDWTATDDCERTSTQQQIRTVSDNNPPLIHNVPPGTTVECHAVPPIDTGVNTTDVCDEHHGYATELTVTEVRANGTCPNQYTLTRTWEATDECNHVTTKTQTIEVVDTIAPVLDPEPTAETVSCESVPQPADVCASDNCTGVELQFNQTRVPGTCTHSYTLQRTWTAYDACLNQKQHTQLVTVQDLTDPHWTSSPLPNRSHELCTDPNRNATGTVTAEDNCDDDVEITIKTSFGPRDCQLEYTVTHIYEAKDDCNNDIVHNETYPVIKTQPPTINTQGLLTPNLECECDDLDSCLSEWPTVQDVCGSDENNGLRFCFPPNNNRNDCTDPTLYKEELLGDYGSDDNCNATNRMRRTWWAIDACGNNASVTQTVIIKDTTPPVFDVNTLPADVNTTCSLPPIVDPNATDTCGDVTVDLTINTPTSMGSCRHEYTVTREWTARDCAGNKVAYNQTIYVQDKTPPYFTSSPQAEVTAECQDVPLPPGLCAKDTCQGVNMTFAEVRSGGSCIHNYNLSRTWVAMDECGNTATETQVVIVEDHEDPKWDAGSLPIQDASDECTMTPITDPWGTDNCGTPTVSYTEFNDTGVCANDFTYTRNYTLTDACDRKATYNVRRVVKDTVDPYFTKFPTNESEQRCTFFTTVPDVQGTDDCNTATVSGPVVTWDNTTCIYEYTKHSKYTLEDECQNSVEKVWSQTVTYNNVPYWMNQPSDRLNLEACGTDESASPSDPNAFDGCHNSIDDNITRSETPTNLTSCPPDRQVVYEWQVTDPCDNSLSFQRTYKWTDNTPPSWNNPGNLPQNEVDLEYSDSPVNCQRKNPGDLTANDACAGMITATPVKNTTDGDCPYRFRDDWKWTATDDCEHSITHSIYISYKHTLGPILNLDETDQNDECDDVQPPRPATATDRCGENITASIVRTSTVDQSCAASGDTAICAGCTNNYDIVHVYSVTDKCNLTTTKQYITRVRDTTMPRLVGVPADVTVECGFEPPVAEVTVADNCPGVRIIYNETIEGDDPDNCCNYTILRRWTAIDACGKSVSKLQKVKVEDTFPPRIDACPDETSECPTVPECNNVTAVEVTAQAWCVEDPTTTDGCSGTGSDTWSVRYNGIDYHSSNLVLVRQANGSAHITGSASDSSNTNTITLHINLRRKVATVNKSTAISNAIASDLLGSCYNAGQPADRNGWRFYYDPQGYITINGGSQLAVTSTDNAQAGLGANGRNAHMGFAYDFTANSQTGQVRLQLDTNPSSSCQLPLLQFPELVCEPISFTNDTHNDVQNCVNGDKVREVITRTWYATDVNGNTAKAVQVVTIVDNTKPTLEYNATEFMEQSSVSCELWPLPWPTVNATDDCETGIVVTTDTWFNESSLGCPNDGKHTRLFEASDECGNKASVSYTITVYDRKGPVIQSPPDNATHECHDVANYQNPPSLTSSDNCDDTNSVTNTRNERINGTCDGNFRIERDYEAYDDCGNPSVYNYTLFFVDTGKPQLINTPPDTSAECSIPASIAPTGVDNCTDDVSVSLKEENTTQGLDCKVNGGHYFSLLRTWTATDSCNNQESYTQTIDVYDTTPPYFTATPLNSGNSVEQTTEECSDIPAAFNVEAEDACRGATVGPVSETQTPEDQRRCRNEYTITRQWTATDDCNNQATFTHNIDVVDTTPPTLDNEPGMETANCQDIPKPADVCAKDNCLGVALNFTETIIDRTCTHNFTLRREWVATDDCGLNTSHVQYVNVTDGEAPQFDQNPLPQGKTVQCHEILAGQHSMQTLTATDNCVNNTVEDTEVPTNNGCNGNYTLTRDWAVWDDCGHNTTWQQVVTVIDTVKPVLNGSEPQDVTVDCQGPRPAGAPPIEQLSATDSCSTNAIDITVVQATNDNIRNGSCPGSYVIQREWTFTDDCNNQLVVNQDVTVRDVTPPHWTFFPDDTTIECDDPIPRVDPTAADNCTTQIMPYVNETSIGGSCLNASRLERKWTACDECNNCITKTQTIYIEDTELPTLNEKPPSTSEECHLVTSPKVIGALDNCGVHSVVNRTYKSPGGCTHEYTLIHEWVAKDYCGNKDVHNQTVIVFDNTAPTFDQEPNNMPQTETIECDLMATYTQPVLTAKDNCDTVSVTPSFENATTGCSHVWDRHETWVVEDVCLNKHSYNRTVHVVDTTPPQLDQIPAADKEITVECDQIPDPFEPTASDNCGGDITADVQYTEEVTNTTCGNVYTIFRSWYVEDCAGNYNTTNQTINVVDLTPPEIDPSTLPANNTVIECHPTPSAATTVGVEVFATPQQTCTAPGATQPNGEVCSGAVAGDGQYALYLGTGVGVFGNGDLDWDVATNEAAFGPTGKYGSFKNYGSNASLTGYVTNAASGLSFKLYIALSGGAPAGSSGLQSSVWTDGRSSCYVPNGSIDPSTWYHYTGVSGWLRGIYDTSSQGVVIDITKTTANQPFQMGTGASLRNPSFGASVDLTFAITAGSVSGFSGSQGNLAVNLDCTAMSEPTVCPGTNGFPTLTVSREFQNTSCAGEYEMIDTFTATDCSGLKDVKVIVTKVEDTTPPDLQSTTSTSETLECDANNKDPNNLPADTVTVTDLCDPDPFKTEQIYLDNNPPCPAKYIQHRNYTAEDCAGKTSQIYRTITVEDTTPPYFNENEKEQDVTINCKDNLNNEYPFPNTPGYDVCDFKNVTKKQEVVERLCTHNYTLKRTYTAYDECELTATYSYSVFVEDPDPPTITPPSHVCLSPIDFDSYYAIPDYAAANSAPQWHGSDTCSNVRITIDSCTSSQDSDFGLTQDASGYTPDCFYDASSDALIVRVRVVWDKPEGRLFTVTATAHDDCNNTATDTTTIFVPLNNESFAVANTPPLPFGQTVNYDGSCVPIVANCDQDCPCEYNLQMECVEDNTLNWGWALQNVQFSSTTGTTNFTYVVNHAPIGATRAEKLLLGLDLSEIEVVSCTNVDSGASCLLGHDRHSKFTGAGFITSPAGPPTFISASSTLSLEIRGDWSSKVGGLPTEVIAANDATGGIPAASFPPTCQSGIVGGPDAQSRRSFSASSTTLAGTVSIVGADTTAQGEQQPLVVLPNAQVNLYTKDGQNFVHQASTFTSLSGQYIFTGLNAGTSYFTALDDLGGVIGNDQDFRTVVISSDLYAGAFVADPFQAVDPAFPFGAPTAASLNSAGNNLPLVFLADRFNNGVLMGAINSTQHSNDINGTGYSTTSTEYRGNPHSVGYWEQQFHSLTENCGRLAEPAWRLNAYADGAAALITAACGSVSGAGSTNAQKMADRLTTGNSLTKKATAMALNHAAFRGIFKPIRDVQAWAIGFAVSRTCGKGTDTATAEAVLDRLLAAN